ncbi:sensor domain-containing protein [Niallia sp. FSL W8-0635]|uniref:sensor domain-containing protein n=1 Tax=Niallia sp. FSL W8-0635 TaxID=2975337 RepID=UPI0009C7897D|nr:cyclic diguanylate phosphodiesterase domain-containing protein [Mycobacteroides abscessus subsp. abscessus]HEO8419096.1 EAL domain-containing protein [Yersinia enterocolitica]
MDYKHSETKWIVAIGFFVLFSVILNVFVTDINKGLFILLQLIITSGLLYVFYQLIEKITYVLGEYAQSSKKLQSIFETLDIAIWFHDLKTNKLMITAGIETIYGYSVEDFYNNHNLWKEVIHPEDKEILVERANLLTKQDIVVSNYRIIKPNGKIRWIKDRGIAIFDKTTGEMKEFTSVLIDITDSKENEDKFSKLVDMSPDIIAVVMDYKLHYINKAGIKIFERDHSTLVGLSVNDLFPEETFQYIVQAFNKGIEQKKQVIEMEIGFSKVNGEKLLLEINCMRILFGGQDAVLILGRDITSRKQTEIKIKELAFTDVLTELPNRNSCLSYLNDRLLNCDEVQSMAVLFLDLDQFKRINDTKGHGTGDIILKKVAYRLKSAIKETDFVARLGGDEFLILLENKERKEIEDVAKKIINQFSVPFVVKQDEFFVTPSIGISMYPTDGDDQESLIKNADAAMYVAKDLGKNNFQFYSSFIAENGARKMELEMALRKAISNKELELYYQPQIDITTGSIYGVEALLRWKHPVYGYLSPDEFIPIAEETNLMLSIGEWVITQAFMQKKQWKANGKKNIKLAINISARQFQYIDFLPFLQNEVQRLQINTANIELEITENIMQNIEKAKIELENIKKLGFQISIDDFGKGYSSLSYLKSLPIDTIKIDKSFIDDINHPKHKGSLAKVIIDMGHNMNFVVIAEGVETKEQVEFLQNHECEIVQGYYYSKPLPPDELEKLYL